MACQRRAHEAGIAAIGLRAARDRHDPRLRRDLPGAVAVIERGQQLARGEVAGAAEDHEVERGDLDDANGHDGPSGICAAAPDARVPRVSRYSRSPVALEAERCRPARGP
jgi:hypothetical protein